MPGFPGPIRHSAANRRSTRMLAGAPSDLTAVRAYLDAERGGW